VTATNGNNGQHKILWWIIGAVLGPIVLAVFGHMLDTTYTDSQKISALEAVLHEVHLHIDRVERKLDQLLDRR
jgi:hypothetical protein